MIHNTGKLFGLFWAFVLLSAVCQAQSTDIILKSKGTKQFHVTISFTSNKGVEGLSAGEFFDYDRVYFTIKPNLQSERDYFRENDIENDLQTIYLTQDGKTIKREPALQPISNAEQKVDRVVFSYLKREVRLYEPFVFMTPFDTAAPIELADEYFMYFNTYKPIFESGSNLCDKKNYIEAYNAFMKIVNDATKNEEIKHYSFYKYASETLIETAIEQYNDSLVGCMNKAISTFSKTFSKQSLDECSAIISKLQDGYQVFTPYMQMNFPKSELYASKYNKLLLEADSLMEHNRVIFRNKRMQFLETGQYNEYQFRLLIDLLAKMITDIESIKLLGGLDTLNIKLLGKFPSKKEELMLMESYNDFEILVTIINHDIRQTGRVFGDSVMANLQRQSATQPQPYHTIFLGFNELEKNQMLFKSYLNEAVKSCTDISLITNLEMWFLSYNATIEGLNEELVGKLNKGIGLITNKKWDEAVLLFDILTKQAGNLALPWYYLGMALNEKGETFGAESRIASALQLYPKYIAPRLQNFNSLYNAGRFDELLPKISEAIQTNDLWLFHFWFAKTLVALLRYDEAIEVLNNSCIRINPFDEQEFFLLGDCYLAKKNFAEAEKAYKKTMEVNPYYDTRIFNEKMILLQESRPK